VACCCAEWSQATTGVYEKCWCDHGIDINDGVTVFSAAGDDHGCDRAGHRCDGIADISPINLLNQGQEVYNFSDIFLGNWPGVDTVHAIKSGGHYLFQLQILVADVTHFGLSGAIRHTHFSISTSPPLLRNLDRGAVAAFTYIPCRRRRIRWNSIAFGLPTDMQLDNSILEPIPQPWTDAFRICGAVAYQSNFKLERPRSSIRTNLTCVHLAIRHRRGRVGTVNQYGRY